jgi:hypothetical protein
VNRVGLAALAALASASPVAFVACDAAPRPANPRLTTLFDVQALYAGGATADFAVATDAGLPGGVPIGKLADRYGVLTVSPAWAESYPVAYVTTEVWAFYEEVWLQPMYVPVTGFSMGEPLIVKGASGAWQPIFGVGAGSGFYSPFWQMIYFQVPDGTSADAVTSVRGIVDGGYPLFTGPGLAAPLTPAGVTIADPMAGGYKPGTGTVDGAAAPFISFPDMPFTWNADDVIREVPLYHFLFRNPDGTLVHLPIPTVVGTGPPYAGTPAPMVNGKPTATYSAFWRLYTVVIPPDAVVYVPPGDDLYMPLKDLGARVVTADYYTNLDPNALYRVALDPGCFMTDPDPYSTTCRYLDSQANIEAGVNASDIQPTAITVTCPIVSYQNMPVAP